MSGEPARRRATYADIETLPDNVVGEIVDGELIASPRPAIRHSGVTSRLGIIMGTPFEFGQGGPGGWIILDEPELHLGEHVLVPDLAGWRRERVPELPDEPAWTIAPDWICEVLSPSTEATDRTSKLRIYANERVGHAWLVDPNLRTLEVFRLEGSNWLLVGAFEGDRKVRAEPFDAVEIDLALLWAR
ncbi:MAG: Uma2 family endonuclease [Deltaproteobacteria bacterium]|nr:Uma2 family endonuclease [Deltaproteobacteria bacterium]